MRSSSLSQARTPRYSGGSSCWRSCLRAGALAAWAGAASPLRMSLRFSLRARTCCSREHESECMHMQQSGTRMPVEHVNSMLKRRWRVLYHGCEIWSLETMVDVIMTCCILHNLCVLDKDAPADEIWGDEEEADAHRSGNDVDPREVDAAAASGMYAVMLALGTHTRC